MKPIVLLFCFLFCCVAAYAECSIGELIDGLDDTIRVLDSGPGSKANEKRGAKEALDYLAGFTDSMRSLGGVDIPKDQKLVDRDSIPSSPITIARNVVSLFHDLHFLRDGSASDFLLSFFLIKYGSTQSIRDRGVAVFDRIVIKRIHDLIERPEESTAFSRWFLDLNQKDPNSLEKLPQVERLYFLQTKEVVDQLGR